MKKYLPMIVVIALAALAIWFVYNYVTKMNEVAETATRVLNSPGLRDEAMKRAQKNGTSLQVEAQNIARQIANAS